MNYFADVHQDMFIDAKMDNFTIIIWAAIAQKIGPVQVNDTSN